MTGGGDITTPSHPTLAAPLVCRIRTENMPVGSGVPVALDSIAVRPRYWHTHIHGWHGVSPNVALDVDETESSAASTSTLSVIVNVIIDRITEFKAKVYS